MSYTKTQNFTALRGSTPADPAVFDTEFDNIATTTAAHETAAAGAHAATAISNTPAGTIAATTVQAAINELDTEKVPLNGTGATGSWGIDITGTATDALSLGGALANTYAPKASPALTGTPTAPTAAAGTATTQLATTAFTTNQDLGVGQTWQNVTASRVLGTTYTNLTGKPILMILVGQHNAAATTIVVSVAGTVVSNSYDDGGRQQSQTVIVPTGSTYSASVTSGAGSLVRWNELR